MPALFRPVPDWFPWENQGADLAVVRRSAATPADLVVLMVDGAAEQNRAFLRLGSGLDPEGVVTGGWTPWAEVPDWFSWENQGAAVAVTDLGGDGTQDLVVAMVDNPGGQNRGFYRVGRALQPNGEVTGGWGPWLEIPDWFSWENQGLSLAVTPPDPQGRRDLVVLTVDDGPEQNRGVYRIGRGLAPDGTVAEWGPWLDVPDWFPWDNADCGVAIADLDGDGGTDLVVFQIDNAPDQNQAFFRVGRDLDPDGAPTGGWGPWRGVPHWFAWANQGGGIAVDLLGGEPTLLVLMVDSPEGANAAYYEALPLGHDPARDGQWELLGFHSGVLAVHAALLPGGKVMFFAGSGSSAVRFGSPLFGDENAGIFTSVVWDPPGDDISHPATLRTAQGQPFDFFCGGDAFLPDGRLLSAGGTLAYNPFKGRKDVAVFDPTTQQWSFAAPMAHGRWYPTLISLGDGTVLATTGLTETGDAHNQAVEVYDGATDTWAVRHLAAGFQGLPLYAHLFLLEDGRVFFTGGRMDDPMDVQPAVLDLAQEPIATTPVPDLLEPDRRNQSASVLLGPAQDQRVLIAGGGPVGKADQTDATDAVSIVDLRAPQPSYEPAAPLALPRLHLNAVLLPDRTVFASGGSLKQEDAPLARLEGEIYDPGADTWSLTAAAQVPRLYHSTALLLPDARVVAAGGNPEGGGQVAWEPPDPEEEMRLEVFSPPYLFRGPRPVIDAVPQNLRHGETVAVTTGQAPDIRWVSLVRNGVTTHSFDSGQRLVDLPITLRRNGAIEVKVPDNPNLAPLGWYMLFLVDEDGVPSVARWVRLEL